MRTPTKITGFVLGLAAVFGAAAGVGKAVGPAAAPAVPAHGDVGHDGTGDEVSVRGADSAGIPGGLMVSQSGYSFSLTSSSARAGDAVPVTFTIEGPEGEPVTTYDVEHEKELHLIAVRRDLSGFQHVHPTMDSAGLWTAHLDLTPGQWRLFADFKATGADPLTLGADLAVSGDYRPAAPAPESSTAAVGEYTVTLAGDLTAGTKARVALTVTRDGRPVTDLEAYLGSYGHLVALRAGDLAYLHVHPEGLPGDAVTEPGPEVVFFAEVPSDGTYHLYLDFQHHGTVRTAAFTVDATGQSTPGAGDPSESPGHDDD